MYPSNSWHNSRIREFVATESPYSTSAPSRELGPIDHVSSDLQAQASSSRAPEDLYLKGGGERQGAGEPGSSPGSTNGLRCRSTPHIFLGLEVRPIIMKL